MKTGEDYVGVCVVFYCHDGMGNVLMGKRSINSRDDIGNWDIGGGKLEFGDTVEDTLKNEIKQEYCTEIIEYEFLGYRDVHRIEKGRKTHWIGLDFKVLVDKNKVRNGEPHKLECVKWFRKDEWPVPTHSQFPEFLMRYIEKL